MALAGEEQLCYRGIHEADEGEHAAPVVCTLHIVKQD